MQYDQQEDVPQLLPIFSGNKRQQSKTFLKDQEKKNISINESSGNKQFNRNNASGSKQNDKKNQQKSKAIDHQRRFQDTDKKDSKKDDDSDKSKILITAMLNKISTKNLSQEKYPVSNQVIDALINGIQAEIMELRVQSDKKIITNMNDVQTRKQKAQIQRSIQRCITIKQLYLQKIQLSNSIKHLETKNIQLRNQNRDLKIKVTRGIQTIENHMHNLPCERQKQLKQQLNRCLHQLDQEKFMRQNLQKKAADIVMNFNRLYEQADTARLIVVRKLRQIEQKEKALKSKPLHTSSQQKSEQLESDSFELGSIDSQQARNYEKKALHTSFPLNLQKIRMTKQQNSISKPNRQQQDESQINSWRRSGKQGGLSGKIYQNYYKGTSKTPIKSNPRQSKSPNIASTVEDRLKKMRENQFSMNKTAKKF